MKQFFENEDTENKRIYIIAEGCDNHLGNVATAMEMISQAKLAGADAIKFQHHLPDEEMIPNVPVSSNFDMPLYEFLKKYALTLEQHVQLMQYSEKIGIQYLCTPFSYKAAKELNEIGIEVFKIGSGEMTDIPTLKKISEYKKPMIVSTGMATYEEIDRTYTVLSRSETPFVLMNCVSEYPPEYTDMNLRVIPDFIKRYPKAIIGHSDHTPDLYTCFSAVTLGARVIEKHVILDKRQPGPDQSVSIDFYDLKKLVEGIRKIEDALGNEKIIHDKEKQIREWAFRSIVTLKALKNGDIITQNDVWSKRPGTGIPSWKMEEVIGRKLNKNVKKNTLLSWGDLD